tara:strand:- start:611 stop:1396 length:786 start_codon:yes stop_codon:yes gene_type:complete
MKGITVGLPMFRSQNIAWLAMESLCAQSGIDFEWELLIAEESESPAFGLDRIKSYIPRLKEVGCKKLEYYEMDSWQPLGRKWRYMAQKSGDTLGFILQASDCYSQPYRLKETHDIFLQNSNIDWVQSPKGYFYNIENEKVVLFDHDLYNHPCALNMAVRTELIRKIPPNTRKASVDSWLYKTFTEAKGKKLNVHFNQSDNWKLGLDTHGLNTISKDRTDMINETVPPFTDTKTKLEDIVPTEVSQLLHSSKEFVSINQRLI